MREEERILVLARPSRYPRNNACRSPRIANKANAPPRVRKFAHDRACALRGGIETTRASFIRKTRAGTATTVTDNAGTDVRQRIGLFIFKKTLSRCPYRQEFIREGIEFIRGAQCSVTST